MTIKRLVGDCVVMQHLLVTKISEAPVYIYSALPEDGNSMFVQGLDNQLAG